MSGMEALLQARNVKKYFISQKSIIPLRRTYVHAIDGVSLDIYRGETLGLVGESGCGKSTLGKVLLRLQEPTEGQITFDGQDISRMPLKEVRELRRRMQMIFQDPYASLNPKMTIYEAIRAPLDNYEICTEEEKEARLHEMIKKVGLNEDWLYRYPHEFSGGQRQRVVIARALILQPEFVVCDEAVSALDVSVRSQVLNLMRELQKEMELTYLFVSHDLSVIKHISDRIAVMYLGQLVEVADKRELFANPLHPYTQALISAIPQPEVGKSCGRLILKGDIPSPVCPPQGCRFHTRCPYATDRCTKEVPLYRESTSGHYVACHMVGGE
ncbi:ABC transporter ATP-binding protein [Roseburia hominis]